MKPTLKKLKKETTNTLYKLLKTFDPSAIISVKCLNIYNDYQPNRGDEVITYRYTFHLEVDDIPYVYDGWCYEDDLDKLAVGIYSHWLLKTHEIYDGLSTAWYTMYVGAGNIVKKK